MAIYPQAPPFSPGNNGKGTRTGGSPPFNPGMPNPNTAPRNPNGGGSPPFNPNLPNDTPMPSYPLPSTPLPQAPMSPQVDPAANRAFLDRWRSGNRIPLNTQANGGSSTLPTPFVRNGMGQAQGGRIGVPMGAPPFMRPMPDGQDPRLAQMRETPWLHLQSMRETPWLHASQAPNGRLPQQALTGQAGASGYPDWFEAGIQQYGMNPEQAAAAWAAAGNAPIAQPGQIAVPPMGAPAGPAQAPPSAPAGGGRERAPLGEGMQYRPRGGQRPMNPGGGMQSMPVGAPQPVPGAAPMPAPYQPMTQFPNRPFNPYFGGYGF